MSFVCAYMLKILESIFNHDFFNLEIDTLTSKHIFPTVLRKKKKKNILVYMAAHAYNPSIWEAEAEGL